MIFRNYTIFCLFTVLAILCSIGYASPMLPLLQDSAMLCMMHVSSLLQAASDVIPTAATDAMQDSVGLSAQTTEAVQSVLGQLLETPKVAFLHFLDQHPEWTKSTAEFTSEFVQAKVQSPLTAQGKEVLNNFDLYLDQNPKLKLSTSEYVADVWANVLQATNARIEVIKGSPLAQGTKNLLSSIQHISTPVASNPTLSVKLNSGNPSEGILSSLGETAKNGFDSILEKYPKLKLSTAEFVSDYIDNTANPKIKDTLDFLDRSPLAINTRSFAARPTSEVAQDILDGVGKATKPVTDIVGLIGTRIITKLSEPVLSSADVLVSSLTKSAQDINELVANNNVDPAASLDTILSSPTLLEVSSSIPAKVLNPNVINEVTNNIQAIIVSSGPAVSKAGAKLAEELSKSGDTLVLNTLDFASKFSSGILSISSDVVTVLPQKSAEILAKSVDSIQGKFDQDRVIESLVKQSNSNIQNIQDLISAKLDSASQWKLFPDEQHWETGFWEQKLRSTVELGEKFTEISKDASKRDAFISDTQSNINQLFSNVGNNWRKIQSSNPAFQTLENAINQPSSSSSSASAYNTLPSFQQSTQSILQNINTKIGAVSKDSMNLGSLVSKELQSFTKEASQYVENFISTNQALDY